MEKALTNNLRLLMSNLSLNPGGVFLIGTNAERVWNAGF